jgi:hypothetical protein
MSILQSQGLKATSQAARFVVRAAKRYKNEGTERAAAETADGGNHDASGTRAGKSSNAGISASGLNCGSKETMFILSPNGTSDTETPLATVLLSTDAGKTVAARKSAATLIRIGSADFPGNPTAGRLPRQPNPDGRGSHSHEAWNKMLKYCLGD